MAGFEDDTGWKAIRIGQDFDEAVRHHVEWTSVILGGSHLHTALLFFSRACSCAARWMSPVRRG